MYKDIPDARFTSNVKRIENTDYVDSIYGKVSDLKSPLQRYLYLQYAIIVTFFDGNSYPSRYEYLVFGHSPIFV